MIKVWWLTNGPDHCKSTEWFDDILVEQMRKVIYEGFTANWRFDMVVPCRASAWCTCTPTASEPCNCTKQLLRGEFKQHAVIRAAIADQPATQLATGRVTHNSMAACPFGPPCQGATMATADKEADTSREKTSVIPKHGAFLPGATSVTWDRLLDDWDLLEECANHEPDMTLILQYIDMVRISTAARVPK
jgi:hypothetical protein